MYPASAHGISEGLTASGAVTGGRRFAWIRRRSQALGAAAVRASDIRSRARASSTTSRTSGGFSPRRSGPWFHRGGRPCVGLKGAVVGRTPRRDRARSPAAGERCHRRCSRWRRTSLPARSHAVRQPRRIGAGAARPGRPPRLAMLPPLRTPFRDSDLQEDLSEFLPIPASPFSGRCRAGLHSGCAAVVSADYRSAPAYPVRRGGPLIRMRHPTWGTVPPAYFLPSRNDPTMQSLSEFVMQRAPCRTGCNSSTTIGSRSSSP